MSTQENKADRGKIKPSLLIKDMSQAIEAVSAALTYGAEKYEERGWEGVEASRYEDALLRHYLAHSSGEKYDMESGLLHLAHLACNALFLLQFDLSDLGDPPLRPHTSWNPPPLGHKNQLTKEG